MGKRKQRIKLNCKLCGEEFEIVPSRLGTAKYCSHKCSNNRVRSEEELEKISKASRQKFIDRPELREAARERGKQVMEYINENGLAFRMPKGYHTDEHKNKISKLMKGKEVSDETKKKIKNNHWTTRDDADIIMEGIIEKREKDETYKKERIDRLINWCQENEHLTGPKMYKKGKYISMKTDKEEYYASGYELEWMKELDNDSTIKFWTKRHGIQIEYEYKNNIHKYLPDFYIELYDGNVEIIEAKGWVRDKEKLNCKISAAKKYCKENGYNYKIIYQK